MAMSETLFTWPIRVYYEDTDAGGVVFYANYLKYMERARTEWLRSLGFEQDQLMVDPGIMFAVRRTEVDYLRPARFNEQLMITLGLQELGRASLTFNQEVRRLADDLILCRGLIKVACIEAGSFRPVPLPPAIKELIPHAD